MAKTKKGLRYPGSPPLQEVLGFVQLEIVDVDNGVEGTVKHVPKGETSALECAHGILRHGYKIKDIWNAKNGFDLIEKEMCLVVGYQLVELVDSYHYTPIFGSQSLQEVTEFRN
jgi:hypothetical protein